MLKRTLQFALLSIGMAWCVPAHAQMAQQQSPCTNQATIQNITCAAGSNVTTGTIIAVWLAWNDKTTTVSSVVTSAGCGTVTLTPLNNPTRGNTGSAMEAYGVATATGSCTITANKSASVITDIIVHFISGGNTTTPVDGGGANNSLVVQNPGPGTGTDAVTSGSATPTQTGDYIFGAMYGDSGNGETQTHGTGFTSSGVINTSFKSSAEFLIKSGVTSQAATFTISVNTTTLVGMIQFSPAASTSSIPWYKIPTSGPSWAISILMGIMIGASGYGIPKVGTRHLVGNDIVPAQSLLQSAVIEMWPDGQGIYQQVPVGTLTKYNSEGVVAI